MEHILVWLSQWHPWIHITNAVLFTALVGAQLVGQPAKPATAWFFAQVVLALFSALMLSAPAFAAVLGTLAAARGLGLLREARFARR